MDFKFAKCEACNTYIFNELDIIAYRLTSENPGRDKQIVKLEGREPWSGIRCICLDCVRFFAENRDVSNPA